MSVQLLPGGALAGSCDVCTSHQIGPMADGSVEMYFCEDCWSTGSVVVTAR